MTVRLAAPLLETCHMKRHLSAWSLGTLAVVLAAILAMPSAARGQEHRIARAGGPPPSVATPAPPPPPPPPSARPASAAAPSPSSQGGGGRTFGGASAR